MSSSDLNTLSARISRFARLLTLTLGLLAPSYAHAADDSAGFVLDIRGVWLEQAPAAKKLSGGDKVSPGATVYPQKPGPNTFIVICLYTGEAKTYTDKTTLPKRVEPSLASRIWAAVHGHYRGGVVHAISRGDVADSVVPITGQGIDVISLVERLPAGSYSLKFTPHAAAGAPQDETAPTTATIAWDPASEHAWAADKIAAGLYNVELLDNRSREPTGTAAALLVCSADSYESKSKAYAEAVALTKLWDEQARRSGAAPFLQSYLAALADEEFKKAEAPTKVAAPK